MSGAFVLDALRTPVGRYGGALAGVRPDDLAAASIAALLARRSDLDPSRIDDVIFGDSNGAGEDNRNVARMAVLLAGLPTTIPGATVTRLCGSGMEAVIQASRAVLAGDAEIVLAGGVESMSRAPYVLLKPELAYPRDAATLHSTTLGWRMVNPAMEPAWTVSLGEGAELLAERYSISREAQDSFALDSHSKAAKAWAAGAFRREVAAVPGIDLETDEGIRADTTIERLASLTPVFRPGGTVTAGNSSQLSDAAAAVLVASAEACNDLDVEPLARVAARAVSALEPQWYGIGPVEAVSLALRRAGIGWGDLVAVELNEAFAAQSLACLACWPELDPSIVNPQGGAIAIGHPLGCSGARLITTLAHQLREAGGGYGLATMCIGVGQGIAIVLES